MRKLLEEYLIWLQADMQISATCRVVRKKLLSCLTDKTLYAKEVGAYFKGGQVPYTVSPKDPTQIVALKKIINALYEGELSFNSIESIDVNSGRYTAGIAKDTVKTAYRAVHELYSAVQLINHSSAEIQMTIGPHLNTLLPKLGLVSGYLNRFRPQKLWVKSAQVIDYAINRLPTETQTVSEGLENFSQLIFTLPTHLQWLQKQVATGDSGMVVKSTASAQDYKDDMQRRARQTKEYFEVLTTRCSLLALPSYFSTLKALAIHSSELMSTASLLTKQSYLDAAAQLNMIRYQIIPQLISELESTEEVMGLKPGLLAESMMRELESYYSQLAAIVDNIATNVDKLEEYTELMGKGYTRAALTFLGGNPRPDVGEKIVRVPDLKDMRDDEFMKRLQEKRLSRLVQAELKCQDKRPLVAAKHFFEKLDSYNVLHQAFYKWSLANIPPAEKKQLMKDYKRFQIHFAELYPNLDRLIVDALTKEESSSWLARVYNGEYKQLYGRNHFKQIMACRNSVLTNIEQSLAQNEFKRTLISKGIAQREQQDYLSRGKTRSVKTDVVPFASTVSAVGVNPTVDVYHKERVLTGVELHQLNEAKAGLSAFSKYVHDRFPHSDPTINDLNNRDKKKLRKTYKKFQAHLDTEEYLKLNKQLVSALNFSKCESTLTVSDLQGMLRAVGTKLDRTILLDTQHQEENTVKETELEERTLDLLPLSAMGAQLESNTLFGQMSKLKLSKTIDDFIRVKFRDFLEKNLDAAVFNQLTFDSLPHLELHKDGPDVVLYKKILNGLHHIQKSLAKLEKAGASGDPYFIIDRYRYVLNILKLIVDITDAKYFLLEAARNRELAVIIHEGLQTIEPLYSIPIIGDYLKAAVVPLQQYAETEVVTVDIIKAWKTQQEIVKRATSAARGQEVKLEPSVVPRADNPAVVSQAAEEEDKTTTLHNIAEQFYRIPKLLNALNIDGKQTPLDEAALKTTVEALINSFKSSSYGPGSLRNILLAVTDVSTQLSTVGQTSRALVMNHVEILPLILGSPIISVVDNAELQLGLKPGTISAEVNKQFNDFYTALVSNLPFSQKQDGLRLLSSTALVEARIKNEMNRIAFIKDSQDADKVRLRIFGGEHPNYKVIQAIYVELDSLAPSMEAKDYLADLYKRLRPFLLDLEDGVEEFTEDFITRITDEDALLQAIVKMQSMQDTVQDNHSECLGSFDKLSNLFLFDSWEEDFSHQATRDKFLHYYQEIQPFLEQIDYHYNMCGFLRKLQTPADFEEELTKIIHLSGKLEELIEGKTLTKEQKIKQSERRVLYYGEQYVTEQAAAKTRLNAFKNNVFSQYLNKHVLSQLNTEVGFYAKPLFAKILLELAAQQHALLQKITIDDDIEASVATKIETVIVEKFTALKAAYVALNQTVKELDRYIAEDSIDDHNPCREEKLQKLRQERETLTKQENFSARTDIEAIQTHQQRAKELIDQIEEYDAMVRIHAMLEEMKSYVSALPDADSDINHKKITEIVRLEAMLSPATGQTPSERLRSVASVETGGMSEISQNKLLNNADGIFKKFLKALWSFLTGWQSKEDKIVSALKQEYIHSTSSDLENDETDDSNNPGLDR